VVRTVEVTLIHSIRDMYALAPGVEDPFYASLKRRNDRDLGSHSSSCSLTEERTRVL